MAGDIKTDLIKGELQERIAKYETWIDGARRFLKYANDDLENPNYSQFEKDQAKAEISRREPNLREWEKDVEIFKLALAQLEEQEKGWNFLREPIRMMIDLLNEVYPNYKANIMFAEYEHPSGEESLALTNFPDDGSIPDILIKAIDAALKPMNEEGIRLAEKYEITPQYGMVLGIVDLIDCGRGVGDEWLRFGNCHENSSYLEIPKEEKEYGYFDEGRYAWQMGVIEKFETPIPAKGQQGFWNWDERAV